MDALPQRPSTIAEHSMAEQDQKSPRSYWKRIQDLIATPLSPSFTGPQSKDGRRPKTAPSVSRKRGMSRSAPAPARALKIKIVSWNMHDSLPKGNVEEILGNVPSYIPNLGGLATELPQFEEGENHPYHLVVIAGQECPTVSGIPLGLAGFKLKDREDKKSKSSHTRNPHQHHHSESSPVKPPKSPIKPTRSPTLPVPASGSHSHLHSQTPTSGWSYILEDWYCKGVGNLRGAKPSISTGKDKGKEVDSGGSIKIPDGSSSKNANGIPNAAREMGSIDLTWETEEHELSSSTSPSTSRLENGDAAVAQGPYQLLQKERLMGIYLTVFVHRDAAHFVEGLSRDTVATGMLKGRIGNKGAVGISMKIAGTTLLFVNAHLAAHEDHVSERLANFDRIKSELVVDAFLPAKDPRQVKEDITDRFDHTFFFGDLNFRLKISRLHADWLVGHEDYDQALKFDQLREIIENKQSFIGFKEGEINFRPTYKFDVMKTLKKSRSKKRFSFKEKARSLYVDLAEPKEGAANGNGNANDDTGKQDEKRTSIYAQGNQSMVSSMHVDEPEARAGSPSRFGSEDGDSDDDTGSTSDNGKVSVPNTPGKIKRGLENGLKHVMSLSPARARSLFKKRKKKHQPSNGSLEKPNGVDQRKVESPGVDEPERQLAIPVPSFDPVVVAPTPRSEKSLPENEEARQDSSSLRERRLAPADPIPHSHSTGDLLSPSRTNSLPPSPPLPSNGNSALPSRPLSFVGVSPANGELLGRKHSAKSEGGVYDTSSKQRVPSWCDRILWKTTVSQKLHLQGHGRRRPSLKLWSPNMGSLSAVRRSASLSRAEVSSSRRPSDAQPPTRAEIISPSKSQPGPVTESDDASKVAAILARLLPRNVSNPQTQMRKSKTIDVPTASKKLNGISNSTLSPEPPVGNELTKSQSSQGRESGPPRVNSHPVISSLAEDAHASGAPHSNPPADRGNITKRWLFGLLPGRESAVPAVPPPEEKGKEDPPPPLPVVHHKGEVICLHYGTLDDSAMRRLEGRSDHRPILGTYSVYV